MRAGRCGALLGTLALAAVVGAAHGGPGSRASTRSASIARAEALAGPSPRPRLTEAATPSIRAEEADPDSALDEFLDSWSDSTERYFGLAAGRPDTTGQDSALAYALEHPVRGNAGDAFHLSYGPQFSFNRVDGPVWGGSAGIGRVRRLGELSGTLGYAAGPNDWLGGARYRKSVRRGALWSLDLFSGRLTESMDRERSDLRLASLRALVVGSDYKRYLRRDGLRATLRRETTGLRLSTSYRDLLETPLATTTSWNLGRRPLAVPDNLAAAPGHSHEIEAEVGVRVPWAPISAEVVHQAGARRIGSDFNYRRTRVAAGSDIGLGRIATLVPQIAYGRLIGDALPQQSFYLGGSHTLRSLHTASRGGTGIAVARLEVIGAFDVLKAAHIPHPAAFPIQVAVFSGIGAVWGADPYGGPARPGRSWPDRSGWTSEVGASVVYQPGLPDPTGLLRIDYAIPVGSEHPGGHWSLGYSRALDFLKPFDR